MRKKETLTFKTKKQQLRKFYELASCVKYRILNNATCRAVNLSI